MLVEGADAATGKIDQHVSSFYRLTSKVLADLGELAVQFEGHGRPAGALRGHKDTATPMLIAGIGYWGIGFVRLGARLPARLRAIGLLALGLAVVAILLLIRLLHISRPSTGTAVS